MQSLKLIILFAIILSLTRIKLKIGPSIGVGALLAGLFFGMDMGELGGSVWNALISEETWQLMTIIVVVSFLGALLKDSGRASDLVGSVESLIHSKRASMAVLPALIGLLPMPGGALLSAPLVDESSAGTKIEPHKLAAINYWFRHILEYVWPLYPGIILTVSILEIETSDVVGAQWPMTAGMIIGGILFLLLPLGRQISSNNERSVARNFGSLTGSLWPILAAVALNLMFGLDLCIAVPLALLLYVLTSRFSKPVLLGSLKKAVTFDYVSFVFSVMIFKQVFADSDAANVVASEITSAGIDPLWVIIFIPFIVGLISGATPAFVTLTYPALLPFLKPDTVDLAAVATAYTCGFLGVLLSPLHFCLVLTVEYFKTRLGRAYLYIIVPLCFMIAGLVVRYVVF